MSFQYDGCNYSMIISATCKFPVEIIHAAEYNIASDLDKVLYSPNGDITYYIDTDSDPLYPGYERFFVLTGNPVWVPGLSDLPLQYPAILPPYQQTNPEDLSQIDGSAVGIESGSVLAIKLADIYSGEEYFIGEDGYCYQSCVYQIISRDYGSFDPSQYSQPFPFCGQTFPGIFPTKFKIESIVALECLNNPILKTRKPPPPDCPPQTPPNCPPTQEEVNFNSIQVPIFSSCNADGTGNNNPLTIQVIAGTEAQVLNQYQQISNILIQQQCNTSQDAAACPDGWLIRPEYHRPQVIYQFAQVDNNGNIAGAPKYRITVPHHIATKPTNPLPNYQKGNWEIIFVLSDNSKVTIHSLDEENGMTVLDEIKNRIISNYLTNAYLSKSCLVATDTPLLQIPVKNRMAKYYSQGTKNELPDWIQKW